MNTNTSALKIAVIGPTQSGKTCLAVGLSATNTSDFTIEPVDVDGSSYLDNLRAGFAKGGWPDPTNKGTTKEIRFDFLKKGKPPIRVSFPEFAGEMLASDEEFKEFANEHFRNLSGVVLLLNPGAEAFQSGDPRRLGDAMSQYKRVLSFLRDENNGSRDAFVALTITAEDRMKGDLAGKLEVFDRSVEELANTLKTSGFRCEKFKVTITGHLKEQDRPTLAKGGGNSAAKPFLWLLDELNWRPKREAIFRKIRRAALAAAVLVAFAGAWCGVDAWNDHDKVQTIENKLKSAIADCKKRSLPSNDDLDAVRNSLSDLKNHAGWFKGNALATANAIEPEVWNVHEKRIRHEMSAIASEPEQRGGDCDRVDKIFSAWLPSVQRVAEERARLKADWDRRKPGYQDTFAVAQMLKGIQKPLREKSATHGQEAFALFAQLYGKLAATAPVGPNAVALKEEISRELDGRVEKEWRDFGIPEFERNAPTRASDDATRAFVALLEGWTPATTNGAAAKTSLTGSVARAVPAWRRSYELRTFEAKSAAARKSGKLEDLAALHHAHGATNEYLTLEHVAKQWKNGLQAAYEEAYAKYIADFANAVAGRRGCPRLDDDDYGKISAKARAVGVPFDRDKARAEIETAVGEKAKEWKARKQGECADWIEREIKSRPGRKGSELVREYIRERRNRQDHEEIFNDMIRREVYRHCERCFEEDIAYFKRKYGEKSECEKRFNDSFKPLCRILAEDAKDPDEVSWAIRFAKGCVDAGCVNKDNGFEQAFYEEFKITCVSGKIDYQGENPLKDFKGTRFGLVVFRDSDTGKPTTILERDKSPVVKDNDGEWHKLSEGQETVKTTFANPMNFGMNVHDDRSLEWDYRVNYDKNPDFRRQFDPFHADVSDEVHMIFGGGFGKQTKDRKLAAYVRVSMKRVAGCGIGVLLSRAKEDLKAEK